MEGEPGSLTAEGQRRVWGFIGLGAGDFEFSVTVLLVAITGGPLTTLYYIPHRFWLRVLGFDFAMSTSCGFQVQECLRAKDRTQQSPN